MATRQRAAWCLTKRAIFTVSRPRRRRVPASPVRNRVSACSASEKGDPWTETVLHIFKGKSGDGNTPVGSVIIDSSGNLYGTTGYGGTGNCSPGREGRMRHSIRASPPAQKGGAWTETVLYSFPTAKQGYLPNGNLVFDSAGNLYGATKFGGGYGTTCDAYYSIAGRYSK